MSMAQVSNFIESITNFYTLFYIDRGNGTWQHSKETIQMYEANHYNSSLDNSKIPKEKYFSTKLLFIFTVICLNCSSSTTYKCLSSTTKIVIYSKIPENYKGCNQNRCRNC